MKKLGQPQLICWQNLGCINAKNPLLFFIVQYNAVYLVRFCDKGNVKPNLAGLVSLREFEIKYFNSLKSLPVRCTWHRIQTSTNVIFAVLQPPWHDTLYALRAKFQAGIWKGCMDASLKNSRPKVYEWSMDTTVSFITTTWLTVLSAPRNVMDLLKCECHLACVTLNCAYIANRLKCTQLGKLQNCNDEG